MAFNKVIMIGNLVADPELKTTTSGVTVARFSIAVNRKFSKAGEQPQTDFFNVVAWRSAAEFVARNFKKGRAILVSGSLQNRSWDKTDGSKGYATEIIAEEVTFVDKKDGNTTGEAAPSVPAYGDTSGFEDLSSDDELPF